MSGLVEQDNWLLAAVTILGSEGVTVRQAVTGPFVQCGSAICENVWEAAKVQVQADLL